MCLPFIRNGFVFATSNFFIFYSDVNVRNFSSSNVIALQSVLNCKYYLFRLNLLVANDRKTLNFYYRHFNCFCSHTKSPSLQCQIRQAKHLYVVVRVINGIIYKISDHTYTRALACVFNKSKQSY